VTRRALAAAALAAVLVVALPAPGHAAGDRLPLAEPGVEGSVERLYQAFFGRPPDGAGLDHWVTQYRDGLPLRTIASHFGASEEFLDANEGVEGRSFVERAYRGVLGREPDADGAAYWEAQLAAGGDRAMLVLALAESPENVARTRTPPPTSPRRLLAPPAVEHSIARVYLGFLGRWPDAPGFDHWVRAYAGGAPLRALTDAVLAAPELAARYGATSDGEFVGLLYEQVLGRAADGAASYWVDQLGAGRTRGEVASAFTESPEMVARTRTAAPARPGRRLLAVGDSVMLGARDNILAIGGGWSISVDVRGCRNPTWSGDGCGATDIPSGVDALRSARADGRMGDVVVLSLGNNGPFSAAQFDEVMAEVRDVPRVIWFNQHEPRSYEGPNNAVIAAGVERHANAELVDWHALGGANPSWFQADGIHLTHAGRQAMADLVDERING
jgi:hypothetical protein